MESDRVNDRLVRCHRLGLGRPVSIESRTCHIEIELLTDSIGYVAIRLLRPGRRPTGQCATDSCRVGTDALVVLLPRRTCAYGWILGGDVVDVGAKVGKMRLAVAGYAKYLTMHNMLLWLPIRTLTSIRPLSGGGFAYYVHHPVEFPMYQKSQRQDFKIEFCWRRRGFLHNSNASILYLIEVYLLRDGVNLFRLPSCRFFSSSWYG